jgi:hypothetical protein
MDCPDFGVCNPSVIQPNVRRQATFLNRDTDSVVGLTPNVELVVGRSSLVVGDLVLANDERPMTNDGFLVELTGIEPVASWLQTRRSPS